MKNTKALFYNLLFVICFALLQTYTFAQSTQEPIYQCAPCGCTSDGKHFHQPGNCPSCGMELVAVNTPFNPLKNLDEPLNVAILLYHHAQVMDYAGPYDVFAAGGENFNVYTVAETEGEVITMPSLSINPQYTILNSPTPDILIVPGGMWGTVSEKTKNWIKTASKEADYVFSICTGAFILAEIGLLDGLEATTHSAGITNLKQNYPRIKEVKDDQRFVDNGKIITSAGVSAGIDTSFYLVSKVLGEDWAKAVAKNLEYPYFTQE